MMKKFTKSPLNYTGGKFKLLGQLEHLFPKHINHFVDLFTGGANVAVNVDAVKTTGYDINEPLIELFMYLKKNTYEDVTKKMDEIIKHYRLSDTSIHGYDHYGCDSSKGLGSFNKEKFTKLRLDYNENNKKFPRELLFFSLIVFGFNNQIRFNQSGYFNMPVGKRDFNKNVKTNLQNFMNELHARKITFEKRDFRALNVEDLKEGDFVYCDPPYLITIASYNEQNGWTEKEEKDLLSLLDTLHSKKVKFALSNITHKGDAKNDILIAWAKKYTTHDLNFNYSNSSYHKKDKGGSEKEVLITNY